MPPHRPLIQQQKLWKTFLVFLLPLIATNILQNLSGTINTVFVGQMMGVNAIAAVAVFFPILFCLMAFVIGLSAGSTVLVGQAWGAQNFEKVRSVVGSTLFMTLIGGSIIAALGVFFAPHILLALGTDPSVLHLSLPYARCMLAGSPLLFVYIIYTSILRGVGDSITPLVALSLTSLIGLVITPVLIAGYFGFPKLGIIAPAIATITGNALVILFLIIYLNKKNHPLKPDLALLKHIRYDAELTRLITFGDSNRYSNGHHLCSWTGRSGTSQSFWRTCNGGLWCSQSGLELYSISRFIDCDCGFNFWCSSDWNG